VEGNELHLSASVGISHFPEDGHEVETLLRAARVARSRVREQGGDGYQFYRPEMENNSKKLLLLENLLYKALQEDQLLVYYQPQVNPASGQIIGMEALVRWKHPERGLVSPAEFIPLAEESGLIIALGRSVLLKACRQAKKWLDAGLLPFRVAVNVSPRQLVKGDLLKTIRDCLSQADLSPAFLEVEITESALMQNPQHALSILQALKGLGVRVALDDFGTGYSSLVYLKNFPIDRLKIAQDFIRNVPAVSKDAAIVQSIFALGRELGIAVIAEGVENKEQLEFLLGLGCTEVQGYYFAKPLDAKTVTGYLKKWFGPNPTCPLRL
jgi:EAL domain-containing protein (putative c-di-GMP-specific phosphodiesterase class I)